MVRSVLILKGNFQLVMKLLKCQDQDSLIMWSAWCETTTNKKHKTSHTFSSYGGEINLHLPVKNRTHFLSYVTFLFLLVYTSNYNLRKSHFIWGVKISQEVENISFVCCKYGFILRCLLKKFDNLKQRTGSLILCHFVET